MNPSAPNSPVTAAVHEALLVLADGTTFEGQGVDVDPPPNGSGRIAGGQVVFNTAMSGYQEVLTDPCNAGRLVCFTYPQVGNYGTTGADNASRRPFTEGVIVRELTRRASNWRSTGSIAEFLTGHRIPVIAGIDTRRLTRHLRDAGSMPGVFAIVDDRADGHVTEAALRDALSQLKGDPVADLVGRVSTETSYMLAAAGDGTRHIVAYDFGVTAASLSSLSRLGTVEVVPAATLAAEVLAGDPDGVFLSSGPGDPSTRPELIATVDSLVGQVPVFGEGLGHQLLGIALGATISRLPFGHHGVNHPVRRADTGGVEITAHDHGFAIQASGAPRIQVTHENLNDGVIEGIAATDAPAFGVQFRPEGPSGTRDGTYLLERFEQLMKEHRA